MLIYINLKYDRSRQEFSNEYFLAKSGFDTAENEPSKVAKVIEFS